MYTKQWKAIVMFAVGVAVWWVLGTGYMDTFIVGGEIELGKMLVGIVGGAVVLSFIIYLLFG